MIKDLKEAWALYLLLIAAGAWLMYAEHPTARNLRRAISDSFDAL